MLITLRSWVRAPFGTAFRVDYPHCKSYMTHQVAIKLDDTTSASDLDSFFTQIWSQDKRVRVVLDATECKKISLGRILSMKGVLDEHRYSSRKYIDHTVVVVSSGFARFILRAGLVIIRTERPVYIKRA